MASVFLTQGTGRDGPVIGNGFKMRSKLKQVCEGKGNEWVNFRT